MKNKIKPIKTNTLYTIAENYRKYPTDESEIEKIDMTETFEEEIDIMIEKGEIVIININAKMRLGKSTAGIAIAHNIIWPSLIRHNKRLKTDKFSMFNIARDDQEFSEKMRDHRLTNNVIVTDEINDLEDTGENVTTEQALKKVFSDVQAGRYVHRVCCSPKEMGDPNADIMLSIITMDKPSGITRSKLYYRYYEGGHEEIQLLGFVDIDVSNIIKNWRNLEPMFLKDNKSKTELKHIEKMREKDFYIEYMVKKYEKMDLLTQEGIFRPRMLSYAQCWINVVEELKPLTKLGNILTEAIIKNFIEKEYRHHKIPVSMVGIKQACDRVNGILTIWKSFWKVQNELKALNKKKQSGKASLLTLQDIAKSIEELQKLKDTLGKTAFAQEEELQHYVDINNRYNNIKNN